MKSTFKTIVLNIRFDEMEQEGRKSTPWANLHFTGEKEITDNFAGVRIAKVRVDPSDNNALARRLHALADKFPIECVVTTVLDIRQGVAGLMVVDAQPAKAN